MDSRPSGRGVRAEDVQRLDVAAGPRWDCSYTARLTRNVG
jgi:hypothetical protein